jgi:hypothetical protein
MTSTAGRARIRMWVAARIEGLSAKYLVLSGLAHLPLAPHPSPSGMRRWREAARNQPR